MQTAAPSLLEREHELEQIGRLVDEACGGRGRTVLIEGPGGIGKTRLLEAARARARDQGMLVLGARPSELERDFPFGVVRQLFEPVIVAAEAPRLARLLEGAAGRAAPLVGGVGRDADTPSDEVDSALVRFHSLYWLTANLAEELPLALVVDDAQWADASSLRFLQFLLPRLDELPVLVAVGARPAKRGSERQTIDTIATDAMTTVLRPAPLSDRAVAALISDELGDASDPRFSDACRKATGGNPFLL
ncbi:MAG: AAA family ATPase, partial [Thermoleophilaceae bacterium]